MSATSEIAAALRRRVLAGGLAPGTPLRQDELAAEFGVSKIPVREALQRLDVEGVVVLRTNRGAVVGALTPARAREVYGLRRALEPALLREAVPRRTIVHLAEAEHALAGSDPADPVANWRFHRALYAASGWTHGLALLEPLVAVASPYLVLYTEHLGEGSRSHDEHERLLAACRDRDADRAVAVLEEHLAGAEATLLAHLEPASEEGATP
jgi:DNA-binding GntR family transcriptional regulator